MKQKPTRSEGEPHNRQTRIANALLEAARAHPEYKDEKLMIFLDGGKTSAIGISGYDDDTEAMVNLFMHLRAMFAANDKELILAPLTKTGRG